MNTEKGILAVNMDAIRTIIPAADVATDCVIGAFAKTWKEKIARGIAETECRKRRIFLFTKI